jgi:hypothetical protein
MAARSEERVWGGGRHQECRAPIVLYTNWKQRTSPQLAGEISKPARSLVPASRDWLAASVEFLAFESSSKCGVRILIQRGPTRTGTRSLPHHPKLRRHFTHSQFFRISNLKYFEKRVRPCRIPQMLQRACSWLRSHSTKGVATKAPVPRMKGWDPTKSMVHLLKLRVQQPFPLGVGAAKRRV